ncbi:unnamed protein product [Spirodela intermedia]|uniref:CAAX prenyl protease 2/Lysostaphin resistance protein A-like domain-containing protein n=1 Tax=Spirodela intermedia TaxID=51605 RepID=A0A7I8INT5_SPIIN|nr:unnamed protein product [Spirodela intermedia]CAA6659635.1 unnamed protein product [Spirodela intermedia]
MCSGLLWMINSTENISKCKVFASRSSRKKMTKDYKGSKNNDSKDRGEFSEAFLQEDESRSKIDSESFDAISDPKSSISNPSRNVSHIAFTEGWVKSDSEEVSFHFQIWHLELIALLVVLVSASRYILLKTWPSFAESSEAANEQALSNLNPVDYLVVACLPGISEELLFRGGLLPLFGLNWTGALVVGAIFGCLHLGGDRRYSFAAWATFVGFVYGMAAVASSSIMVPMASHCLNNLVGAFCGTFPHQVRDLSLYLIRKSLLRLYTQE